MKTIKKIITTLLILNFSFLIPNSDAVGQTVIPAGDVSGTWTTAGSPYQIMGDITVPAGQTLEIQAGVKVEFQGHYYMLVYGKLQALGEQDNMAHFTVNDTTGFWNDDNNEGAWRGIVLRDNDTDLSVIDYCKLDFIKGSAIASNNYQNSIIKNCEILYSKIYHPIHITGYSEFYIVNNKIFNSGMSIIEANNVVFSNNLICNNKGGVGLDLLNTGYFSNNTVSNNNYRGLDIFFSNIDVYNCIISGNETEAYIYGSALNTDFYNTLILGGESSIEVDYNGGNYTLNNVIDSNPQFLNPTTGQGIEYDGASANWKLSETSPCIDAGTPDTTGLHIPIIDLAGEPRIYNDIIDIGAYEYQGYTDNNEITDAKINIYPIPSSETIKILFNNVKSPKIFIKVYNISGKTVYEKEIKNKDKYATETINFSKYAKGIYIINFKYDNKDFTRKIIIQ